jgi:hypothetical protein
MGENQNKMKQNKNATIFQDVVLLKKSITYENDYNNLQKESIHSLHGFCIACFLHI